MQYTGHVLHPMYFLCIPGIFSDLIGWDRHLIKICYFKPLCLWTDVLACNHANLVRLYEIALHRDLVMAIHLDKT